MLMLKWSVRNADEAAQLLRDMRLARGWPQQDLADAIGYSRTSVTNMEAGRQVITFDVMCRAADVLGFRLTVQARDQSDRST